MSSRKASKAYKHRGPSRPINPRQSPGRPAPKRIDSFAIGLISVSLVIVLAIIVFFVVTSGGNNGVATVPVVSSTQQAGASATQQIVAFETQTAPLPRITPQDALALFNSNNAKFIDVRPAEQYATKHVKGAPDVPYTTAQSHLSDFPHSGNLILYCQ